MNFLAVDKKGDGRRSTFWQYLFVSYYTAIFAVCTFMTNRLPSDAQHPNRCGMARMVLMLQPGVD